MTASAFAPAKVNLFLHIGVADAEGMHPLCSLMAFADIGDRLTLEPASQLELAVTGLFGEGLSGGEDNLVMRAARLLAATSGRAPEPFRLTLDKQLPIASGLGGGSSDAGAALRLLRDAIRPSLTDGALMAIASQIGSDGPACLFGRPVIARGSGERLSPAPAFAALDAVLVNPGVASPTGAVYREFDRLGPLGEVEPSALPAVFESAGNLVEVLAGLRNDLQAPAISLNPVIGEVLDVLGGAPESLLARVSGSGATCFSLCESAAAATALSEYVLAAHPEWWVRPCRLGGPWF